MPRREYTEKKKKKRTITRVRVARAQPVPTRTQMVWEKGTGSHERGFGYY